MLTILFIHYVFVGIELDVNTMFEWQHHSQLSHKVPHYKDLLEYINLSTQVSKFLCQTLGRRSLKVEAPKKSFSNQKSIDSFADSTDSSCLCVVCKSEKHPLYARPKFKSILYDDRNQR